MKNIQINGDIEDISAMLIGSIRYALGRKTYIVDWTCEFISNNLHLLTNKDINVAIRDIKQQEKIFGLGDDCDIASWHKLLKILEEHINE